MERIQKKMEEAKLQRKSLQESSLSTAESIKNSCLLPAKPQTNIKGDLAVGLCQGSYSLSFSVVESAVSSRLVQFLVDSLSMHFIGYGRNGRAGDVRDFP